jgi:GMP synthase-like glutamine amidotransferase
MRENIRGLIIDHNSAYHNELIELFDNCDVINYKYFTEEHVNKYDYIVLSGGDINISHEKDLVEEKKFIIKTDKPIFGICLGMQIISISFGENLKNLHERRMLKESIKLDDLEGELNYNHECYIEKIPEGLFGITEEVDNHPMVISLWKDNILAFQGHPEISGEFGKKLRDIFLSKFFSYEI